jgi:hypothetical protein
LPGFHRFGEFACFSWLSTEMLCLSESVDFLSLLDLYLPVFLVMLVCVCVCLCHGVHWQTNRHSREITEIVPAHTRAHTHAEITRTPLSCGDDECDADSLSLLMHIYTHTDTNVFVFLSIPDSWLANSDSLSRSSYNHIYQHAYLCVSTYVLFVLFWFGFLSIPDSWLPNSLFLLDTGILFCTATSCRPCHPAFLLGFHRFCECACLSWLSTGILCLSESAGFLSLL